MLNPARRSSSSSSSSSFQIPPSSPPSILQLDGVADSQLEARDPPSPAQTLWTAPLSPTQTLGHSSPELPPLALASFRGTPSTAARQEETDTASYFTASWGSPYRRPPPSFNLEPQASTNLGSDDFVEDASSLHFGLEHLLPRPLEDPDSPGRFNLEHLLPRLEHNQSPNQFNLDHLVPSRLSSNLDTPTRLNFSTDVSPQPQPSHPGNPSEAWVRQFLDSRWNRAASSWLNDDTEESDQEQLAENFNKSHRTRTDNKTLNQQDFWSHFSEGQKKQLGKMMASRYANPDPHPRQASGGSTRSALGRSIYADKPAAPAEAPESLNHAERTSNKFLQPPVAQNLTLRPRKKILVKGKGCIISIPRDVPRGMPGYPPKPMSAAAVQEKMRQFERAGYDTRGYDHWNSADGPSSAPTAQNRGIWPDEQEYQADRGTNGHKVRVPVKAEWDAYVNHLMEAKLAALGVSLGGEEEESPQPMSRQLSSQYPSLPFSPPLPTNSGGSHRMRQGSIVSGSFPLGPSPGHASRQSISSPMGFGNARASMHMHRHSTFASPASFVHHSASPSGAWSPSYFGPQGVRGGSPGVSLSRPDLSNAVSPGSPFGLGPNPQFPPTPTHNDDLLVHMQQQQQQQQLQTQLMQQQQQQQQQLLGLRPSSTLAEVPEDEAEEEEVPPMKHIAQPASEIAVPTPRGHRHNISANLEREARDAEYHLEQAIDKQFDEGGDFSTEPEITPEELKPSNPVTNSTWEGSRPILHQPQPHSRAHSLAKSQQPPIAFGFPQQPENPCADSDGVKSNVSDATNPSLEDKNLLGTANSSAHHSKAASMASNSWKDPKFTFGKPGSGVHSKHTSRLSMSRLNVEAKEFKFNPSASFSPVTTAFKPNGFGDHRGNKPSFDDLSILNVTAPAFKPNAPAFTPTAPTFTPTAAAPAFTPAIAAPPFKPAAMDGSALPTSGFSFLANGPSFKPNAPAFSLASSQFEPQKEAPAPTNFSSKIFGDVNISASDIVKPAKRSKAIPIVRPERSPERPTEPADQEDESGRITQADGREKRARRQRNDGDEVPKFALQPSLTPQPLGESRRGQAAKLNTLPDREALPEDKENVSPDTDRARPKSRAPQPLSLQREALVDEAEKSDDIASDSRTPIDDRTPHESDAATPTVEGTPQPFVKKHGHKTSSLSATAKPFEFRPQFGTTGYDFGIRVTTPSVTQTDEPDRRHISPARYASRSPATTFRPSDDGSFKTALEGRRHVPYPESESVDFEDIGQASFNDIDAVMKHMNEEGSDFGVERDEPAWEQSSPRLSPHNFERTDLPPGANMRSDAPSPSPRRLYAQRNLHPSSTSMTQDPFDEGRAGITYNSPVRRLNNANDVPVSDWDEGLLSEGEDKIQTRSRFFDSHVDDIIGRLLQDRLDPLERNLHGIQEAIAMISQRSGRGRRSLSTNERLDSDADDEDDEIGTDSHYRNRSPRKDRKMEKIRSIIREALDSHQPPVTSLPVPVVDPVLPEKIRDIVVDALAAHQPPAPAPAAEPINAEEIRLIVAEAVATHAPQPPIVPQHIWPDDIKAIVTEALASQPTPSESIQPDTIRSIIAEAISSHQPQLLGPPIPEIVLPDQIRAIVDEALASHKPAPSLELAPALGAPVDIPQPQVDLSEIYQVIGSLKASIAQTTSNNLQAEDVRELLDEAFKRQNAELAKKEESQAIKERDTRIADLEAMLKEATLRLDNEVGARQLSEKREADSARLLKVTEEELDLLRKAASDDENKIRALNEECNNSLRSLEASHKDGNILHGRLGVLTQEYEELRMKTVELESSEQDLKKKLDAVTAENEALTFTLEEHRLSANKWRSDLQQAHEETERMRKAIEQSRYQAEEATRVREAMRAKFEKLQQDMSIASGQAATERAHWQKADEEHMKKYEVLSARIEAEGRTRERLERELERLETQEREGMKLRITLEQVQKHNNRLEDTIDQLRQESEEHQRTAARYEREYHEAREAGHVEIRRTRMLMEADIEAANNQVNIVRADLEAEVARVRSELDNVRLDEEHLKAKHELDLEAASDAKKQAVAEALESRKLALLEQQQVYEARVEQLSKEHARAIEIAREDKERAENYHAERLTLAESKMENLQGKIALLEEKLTIAKEAASAAAAAAQSIKSPSPTGPAASYASGVFDKISPQALRESIGVLQEQLQERESRIESLEQQLSSIDTAAPAKLKERDTEISWLRELLGVRIDDLTDLINALAQPSFDRDAVRDAAIRIRTNLQMEQQEKERLLSPQSFPTLATLSNFASPKAVQFAAAFGNWRKSRENMPSGLGSSVPSSRNETPSRAGPASAQSFLSGLMTPPTTNLRRTPSASSRSSSNPSGNGNVNAGFPSLGKQPSTPPLLRKGEYDRDAEYGGFNESGFYDDEESTVSVAEEGDVTPVELGFGRELRR